MALLMAISTAQRDGMKWLWWFPPAWWITECFNSLVLKRCYYWFYSPIGWACVNGPEPMSTALDWYLGLFAGG